MHRSSPSRVQRRAIACWLTSAVSGVVVCVWTALSRGQTLSQFPTNTAKDRLGAPPAANALQLRGSKAQVDAHDVGSLSTSALERRVLCAQSVLDASL